MANSKNSRSHTQKNTGRSKAKVVNIVEEPSLQEESNNTGEVFKSDAIYNETLALLRTSVVNSLEWVRDIVEALSREGELLKEVFQRLQQEIAAHDSLAQVRGVDFLGTDITGLIPKKLFDFAFEPGTFGTLTLIETSELERLRALAVDNLCTAWPNRVTTVSPYDITEFPPSPSPYIGNPVPSPFTGSTPAPYIGDPVASPFTVTSGNAAIQPCSNR